MNKKGEEYVEASISLTILMLLILSVILLFVFFFDSLLAKTDVHLELMEASDRSGSVFGVVRRERDVNMVARGLFRDALSTGIEERAYSIDQEKAIRAGSILEDE